MPFCLESPEIFKIETPTTLEAYNIFCISSIEVRSKTKLQPSSRSFQRYVVCHLHTSKSRRFSTFSGHESNWHFDLGLSFGHNMCFKHSNVMCEPILDLGSKSFPMIYGTFQSNEFCPLQCLFEDSRIHWDSNSQSGSPLESMWVHSMTPSYTPRNMKCDSQASLSARTFASPYFGCNSHVVLLFRGVHFLMYPISSFQKFHNIST